MSVRAGDDARSGVTDAVRHRVRPRYAPRLARSDALRTCADWFTSIGSGSVEELLKWACHRQPVMIRPNWARHVANRDLGADGRRSATMRAQMEVPADRSHRRTGQPPSSRAVRTRHCSRRRARDQSAQVVLGVPRRRHPARELTSRKSHLDGHGRHQRTIFREARRFVGLIAATVPILKFQSREPRRHRRRGPRACRLTARHTPAAADQGSWRRIGSPASTTTSAISTSG